MGLSASAGRETMLVSRKSDIEFKVQIINQRRTTLAQQSAQLARQFANAMYQNDDTSIIGSQSAALPGFTAPTSGAVPQVAAGTGWYESQMTAVQALDKELELREKDLQTQNKEVETELDVVRKIIDKSIEKGFKTLG